MSGTARRKLPSLSSQFEALKKNLKGEVYRFDETQEDYARDESILRLEPKFIACPAHERDVQAAVAMAKTWNMPIIPRGGGSGVAGQAIGEGLILDFAKNMHQVLEISSTEVRVQPGLLLNDLNEHLRVSKMRFAPDPSSRAKCAIGGMIGTNASGPRCFRFGSTRNHVLDLKVVLADGSLHWSSELKDKFPDLVQSIQNHESLILKTTRKVRKNSSGYHLASLLESPPSFTGLLVGSEGTLAVVVEARLKVIPLPERRFTSVYGYTSLEEAIERLPDLRKLNPVAIELVDEYILGALGRIDPAQMGQLGLDPAKASLWVEWEGERPVLAEDLGGTTLEDESEQSRLWTLRSVASKALHEQAEHQGRKPLRCIEDVVLPPDVLGEYVTQLRKILKRRDCDGAIFGHAGDAHVHVNPMIDVQAPNLPTRVEELMDEVYSLALDLGGSISGEHGDGVLRKKYFSRQWVSQLLLFQAVKNTMDPTNLLNPGKLWGSEPAQNLPLKKF